MSADDDPHSILNSRAIMQGSAKPMNRPILTMDSQDFDFLDSNDAGLETSSKPDGPACVLNPTLEDSCTDPTVEPH